MKHDDIKSALKTALNVIDYLVLSSETERYNSLIMETTLDKYPKTQKWVRSCYNLPKNSEIVMEIVNEILGGYGVEGSQDKYGNFLVYVNTGETYDLTLCKYNGKYIISSWGDIVEQNMDNFN